MWPYFHCVVDVVVVIVFVLGSVLFTRWCQLFFVFLIRCSAGHFKRYLNVYLLDCKMFVRSHLKSYTYFLGDELLTAFTN